MLPIRLFFGPTSVIRPFAHRELFNRVFLGVIGIINQAISRADWHLRPFIQISYVSFIVLFLEEL